MKAGANTVPDQVSEKLDEAKGRPVEVHVRIGKYAEGYVGVRRKDGQAAFVGGATVPYRRPGLEALAPLQLAVGLTGSFEEATGGLTSELKSKLQLPDLLEQHAGALGWGGLEPRLSAKGISTDIKDGAVNVRFERIHVAIPHVAKGTANFVLSDDSVSFMAEFMLAKVGPLAPTPFKVCWSPAAGLSGNADVDVDFGNAKGTVQATYSSAEGFKVHGTIEYRRDRFSGQITVVRTDKETADGLLAGVLPPKLGDQPAPPVPGGPAGAAAPMVPPPPKPANTVVAYGDVDFQITDWFAGKARVIVDSEGKLTIVGEIAPPAEVIIMKQQPEKEKKIGPRLSAKAMYGIPYVANVSVELGAQLSTVARLGPMKLYKIILKGQWSERDDIGSGFSIQGSLNASAYAALRVAIELSANAEVLFHEVKAGAGILAEAGIKGYAEATPTIGMREVLAPDGGKKPEYFIKGDLELAAQPVLRFAGYLFVEIDAPALSPIDDQRIEYPLGELEYPLSSGFGLAAHFDYVLGSEAFPEISFSPASFDPQKFGTDLINRDVPKKASDEGQKPATWKDGGDGAAPTAAGANPGTSPPTGPAALSMIAAGGGAGGGGGGSAGGGGSTGAGGSGSGGGGGMRAAEPPLHSHSPDSGSGAPPPPSAKSVATAAGATPIAKPGKPSTSTTAPTDRIDVPVPMEGINHHLVNDGPSGALILHSAPTLVSSIQAPALQALVGQYNAIQLSPSITAWSSPAKVRQARDAKAHQIAAWLVAHGPPGVGPGGSAPGLGIIERHGAQGSRLTKSGVPLWVLESEHVIPFDVIRGLGEVLGTQGRAPRGVLSAEDRALTTIAIYERAANYKTGLEISRRNQLSDEFTAMAARFANRADYEDPEVNRTMRSWVLRALRREGSWYVDLTWEGVQFEHAMPDAGSTRGARRAEASPLPTRSQIQSAVNQEIQDATDIVDAALLETARPGIVNQASQQ